MKTILFPRRHVLHTNETTQLQPITLSEWETQESIFYRVLTMNSDSPVSGRLISFTPQHSPPSLVFESLRFTLIDVFQSCPLMTDVWDYVVSISHKWIEADVLYVYLDILLSGTSWTLNEMRTMSEIRENITQWIMTHTLTDLQNVWDASSQNPQIYYDTRHDALKRQYEWVPPDPYRLDTLYEEKTNERQDITVSTHIVPVKQMEYTLSDGNLYTLDDTLAYVADMFRRFCVPSPSGCVLSVLILPSSSSDDHLVSVSPFSTPLSFTQTPQITERLDDFIQEIEKATMSQTGMYIFHSSLGIAVLRVETVKTLSLSIVTSFEQSGEKSSSHTQTVFLETFNTFLESTFQHQGGVTRHIHDTGSRVSLAFRGLSQEFSWNRCMYTLLTDPLLRAYIVPRPRPLVSVTTLSKKKKGLRAHTTESDGFPQKIEWCWTPFVCRLWGIPMTTMKTDPQSRPWFTLSFFRVPAEKPRDPVRYEIRFDSGVPFPEKHVPSLTSFLMSVFLYTTTTTPLSCPVDDCLTRIVKSDRQLDKTIEKEFLSVEETDLTRLNPRVFVTPFYKSLCQSKLQPKMVTQEDAMKLPSDEHRLLFPEKEIDGVEPTWYVCQNAQYPYPGLKKNILEDAVVPLVPCCFERPQNKNNREKLLKMSMGVDVVSSKKKQNIIHLHHVIRTPGQLGLLPDTLQRFFLWNHPDKDVYRMGCPWTPYSMMECLQYVAQQGESMPLHDWYPLHLMNLLVTHSTSIRSCLPFHDPDSLYEMIKSGSKQFWVDPTIFLPFFEIVYKKNIVAWKQDASHADDYSLLCSPSPQFMYPDTVFLLFHYGGRMDKLCGKMYPQCELIVHTPLLPPIPPPPTPVYSLTWTVSPILSKLTPTMKNNSIPPFVSRAVACVYSSSGTLSACLVQSHDPQRRLTVWCAPPSLPAFSLPPTHQTQSAPLMTWSPLMSPETCILSLETLSAKDLVTRVVKIIKDDLGMDLKHTTVTVSRPPLSKKKHVLIWVFHPRHDQSYALITMDMFPEVIREVCVSLTHRTLHPPIGHDVPLFMTPWYHKMLKHSFPPSHLTETLGNPYSLTRNQSVLMMIRRVCLWRLAHFLKDTPFPAGIPAAEKTDMFFRIHTMVSFKHYETVKIPLTLSFSCRDACVWCCFPPTPDGKVVIPDENIRSRLWYFLQWIMCFDTPTLTTIAESPTGNSSESLYTQLLQPVLSSPFSLVYPMSSFLQMFVSPRSDVQIFPHTDSPESHAILNSFNPDLLMSCRLRLRVIPSDRLLTCLTDDYPSFDTLPKDKTILRKQPVVHDMSHSPVIQNEPYCVWDHSQKTWCVSDTLKAASRVLTVFLVPYEGDTFGLLLHPAFFTPL